MSSAEEARAIALARAAALPLSPVRAAAAGALLAAWLEPANELSRKMSAAQHAALLPATVFTHPSYDEES